MKAKKKRKLRKLIFNVVMYVIEAIIVLFAIIAPMEQGLTISLLLMAIYLRLLHIS
jgi:hypothetical protein